MIVTLKNLFLSALVATAVVADPTPTKREPASLAKRAVTPNSTGTNGGFYYSWWSDGRGDVTYTMGSGGSYSVSWSNVNNFVGGKGWQTGSARTITYTGSVNCQGNFYVAIYGWTRNPLIEYYIIETYGTYNPSSGASNKGSISTDGSNYQLGVSTRTNQPSIEGTSTFNQFWSTRSSKRVGGTVTVGTHFNAWSSAGMRLGSHDYMIVATEGYQSSGSGSITVGDSSTGGGSTTTSGTQPTQGGGSCTDRQVDGDPYGCAQQAAWGNCQQSWMVGSGNCLASCNACSSAGTTTTTRTTTQAPQQTCGTVTVTNVATVDVQVTVTVTNGSQSTTTQGGNGQCTATATVTAPAQTVYSTVTVTVSSTTTAPTTTTTTRTTTTTTSGPVTTDGPSSSIQLITKCRQSGVMAVTFDDGPDTNWNTIINSMDAAGFKTTFFVNGNLYGCIYNQAALIQKAIASGHQVGNHGWAHQHMASMSSSQIQSEITKVDDALQKIINCKPTYMRPPYGESSSTFLSTAQQIGYKYLVNWDTDSQDWNGNSVSASFNTITANGGGDGRIVLMHSNYQNSAGSLLNQIISWAKSNNKKLVTVGECMGDQPYQWYRGTCSKGQTSGSC